MDVIAPKESTKPAPSATRRTTKRRIDAERQRAQMMTTPELIEALKMRATAAAGVVMRVRGHDEEFFIFDGGAPTVHARARGWLIHYQARIIADAENRESACTSVSQFHRHRHSDTRLCMLVRELETRGFASWFVVADAEGQLLFGGNNVGYAQFLSERYLAKHEQYFE